MKLFDKKWSPLCALCVMFNLLVIAGCGGNNPRGIPRGDVTGEVLFQQKPVTEGVVTFYSEQTGIAAPADLDGNGLFTIPDGIEIGTYTVTVAPPFVEEVAGAPPASKPTPQYENIPQKYRAIETSDLRADVKEGGNQYVFKME
ncbi:hypothetical protein [Gimesia fumaroli]|uniref:Cna protein B-type domain protein n=1 Tax=Gimesia fumaroli TaxID=2527976 RepID=A0A518IAD1_9PLAN|nr:hypothetical protein [Gimesia fumaroli]QDV49992.1 hypothetical protein Enr17x_20180 [Gimesia fumaroli]